MDSYNRSHEIIMFGQKVVSVIALFMCIHVTSVFARSSDFKHLTYNITVHAQKDEQSKETAEHADTKFSQVQNHNKISADQDNQETKLAEAIIESSFIHKTSVLHTKNVRRKRRIERKKDRMSRKQNRNKSTRKKPKSLEHFGLKQKSCPTVTIYVYKKTAEDVFGETVDVYPVIHIGNLAIDQYFYETFCDVEKCECAGVDNTKYKSSCQTTHNYSYARIVKSGEIGWGLIKVRSGCSCVVKEKITKSVLTIADLLS